MVFFQYGIFTVWYLEVHVLDFNYFAHDLCLQFGCCGIDGGDDYSEAKKWDRERVVKVQNTDQNVTLETPFSCCKVQGNFPDVEPVDEKCAVDPSAANNNKDTVSMIHPTVP